MSEAAVGDYPNAVAARAERCTWLWLEAATDWFGQVAWDIDLIALRPGRTSLAVLAATDSD